MVLGLNAWREFYAVLGQVSATLVALLFVAASVGTGVFSTDRTAALRMFLSASVVHFSSVLAVSLVALAPIQSRLLFGAVTMCFGIYGVCYSGLAWRGAVRDGMIEKIDLEDRLWYAAVPACAYLVETGSGAAFAMRVEEALVTLALAAGLLLAAGIRNAWDITTWIITRRKE